MTKLRITDSETIKSCEREMIDTIIGDLDWDVLEKIFKEKHQLSIEDDVEYREGDLVVHDNQVAYKLDFDVKVTLTVLFDRNGDYLSLATSADFHNDIPVEKIEAGFSKPAGEKELHEDLSENKDIESKASDLIPSPDPESESGEDISGMAAQIAAMIS